MNSFLRIVKFGFQDIARNLGLSFMTVFILVLMLFAVNLLWSVELLTSQAVSLIKDQVNINIFLKNTASDKEVDELVSFIKTFPEVTEVKMMNPGQVLDLFKNRHKNSPEVLDALKELDNNPFGPTVSLKTREPGDYEKIINNLAIPEYQSIIDSKSFEGNETAVEHLQVIMNRVESVVAGLAAVFAIISFLVIFNTIRVAIYTQRTEIGIKRLVGANSWFIRGPYFVDALVFTILSIAITFGIMYVVLDKLDPYVSSIFTDQFSLTKYYASHILYLLLVQFAVVLALTILSSSLAMRKHLRA